MTQMKWQNLLSERRIFPEHNRGQNLIWSGFGKDRQRIIESASFRRLQDKTQVFPLDRSDFIRTRLTHSLEVSSIGKSLAQIIGRMLIETHTDPEFGEQEKEKLCEVLECAGLIHDIGNPPFGHFGEDSVREWFRKNLGRLHYQNRPVETYLSKQEAADFLEFEGNAQGFRLVTHLHDAVAGTGMNLTAANLAAILKYPASSLDIRRNSPDPECRKMGYMEPEEKIFQWVEDVTGCGKRRAPMALILEAADDIAYASADIEDAFKKHFFNYETFLHALSEQRAGKEEIRILKDYYDFARLHASVNPEESAIRKWVDAMREGLIISAAESFVSHYDAIMNGEYHSELISRGRAYRLLNALKQIAYDFAFTSSSIYRTEIAANTILTFLLDHLVPAALTYDTKDGPGLMEEKYLSLISENYKQGYAADTGKLSDSEKVGLRIRLATDSVSSMTDSYARNLYAELRAVSM